MATRDDSAPFAGLTLADIQAARARLDGVMRATPMFVSHTLTRTTPGDVHLKAECLQRTGSFKIRGAYNKISQLVGSPQLICVSAGNHAQGVGLAAQLAGLSVIVVMPENAPLNKVERTRDYGAEVVLHGRSVEQAYEHARELMGAREMVLIHPFDDRDVIAGQGTLGLEVLEQLPDVGTVVIPAGGGGLLTGVAMAIKETKPGVRVIGVQAEGADSAYRSVQRGEVVAVEAQTLADGIRIGRVSELTLALMQRYVDDIVLVSDEEITEAMVTIMDRSRLVVEAAGAAAVAALQTERIDAHGVVCAVLSGGNIDLNVVARVIERGLTRAGRYTMLQVDVADRPGSLLQVLRVLERLKVNVLDVKHRRAGYEVPVGTVEIDLLIETRNRDHAGEIKAGLIAEGLDARIGARD